MAVRIHQFVKNLIQSGLFTADELAAFQEGLPPERQPNDAESLAHELVQARKLTKYQAACVYQGRTQGLVLGDYVVLEQIGRGGMGQVFKARHRRMDRVVALKELPQASMHSPRAVERFHREVKAAARLVHPNIVTAYDAGEAEGIHFLAMEYVDGLDLANVLAGRGPLPIERAVDYVIQAARGLEYAHQQGIVHRDIKPGNLLVDQQGTVKILDMGLARLGQPHGPRKTEGPDRLTETWQVMGTSDYMAPEQAEDTHAVDHRADVYSLGCTLYRLVTGHKPYQGETPVQILLAHREAPIPSLCAARPDVPAELDAVCQKMMAKRPDDRPQSMTEVITQLQGCLTPATAPWQPAAPVPPPAPEPPPVPKQKESSTDRKLKAFFRSIAHGVRAGQQHAPAAEETAHIEGDRETGVGARADAARASKTAAARAGRRRLVWLGIAGGVAALLVLLGSLLAVPRGGGKEEVAAHRPAVLALDWPPNERSEAAVCIDGREQHVPDSGPVEYQVEPGRRSIVLLRRGFEPLQIERSFQPAERFPYRPDWVSGTLISTRIDKPKTEPESPETAWAETDSKARALIDQQRFGEAKTLYERLGERVDDLRLYSQVRQAVAEVEEEAKTAFQEAEARARQLSDEKKFADARAALEPVVERSGIDEHVQAAQKLLAEIKTAEEVWTKEVAESDQIERYHEVEARYADATSPAEKLAAAWDFDGALKALDKVQFEEEDLAARLAARRVELKRLSPLKIKIIDTINAADPPLRTTAVLIPGPGGDVVKADQNGITVKRGRRGTELLAWSDLGPKAPQQLVQLAIDPKDPDDRLAAGILTLATGDVASAETHFEAARAQGAETGPYVAALPRAAFDQALVLLDKEDFHAAAAALADIEQKHADTPWFAANKVPFEAARAEAKAGLHEAEAEELYQEAAGLFNDEQPFDVKPLVEKLKAEYAASRAVTDPTRKPSFAELEQATAALGRFITVRQDGQGDFTSIQAAIDAAPPNSLIEIQDNGRYNEKLVIGEKKKGLTLRGKQGCWPVVTSVGPRSSFQILLENLGAPGTTIERLVLAHPEREARNPICLMVGARAYPLRVRFSVLYGRVGPCFQLQGPGPPQLSEFTNCVLLGRGVTVQQPVTVRDSLWLAGYPHFGPGSEPCSLENVLLCYGATSDSGCQLRACTAGERVRLGGEPNALVDCILHSVEAAKPQTRIASSVAFAPAPFGNFAKPGLGCFRASPQFVDPENLDYRLLPTSPCVGKASDGGDLGCRYTPEMVQMLKLALELRAKGIIKF